MAGPLVLPKGWQRKHPLDLEQEFITKQGRPPTDAEKACLKKAVDKAKHGIGIGRNGEWEFEHGWFAGLMTVAKGGCLTAKEWDNDEAKDYSHFKGGVKAAKSAGGKSRVVVGARVNQWKHDHPSGPFAWISKAVKSVAKVVGKISKVVLPIAKLVPFLGQGISAVEGIAAIGKGIVDSSKVLSAGVKLLPASDHAGFAVGAAMMNHKGLTPQELVQARKQLKPEQKRGFDAAVSTISGMATSKAPANMPPEAKAGFYVTQGLQGGTVAMKAGILKEVAKNPIARKGAIIAAKEIKDKTLWQHVKEYLGFHDFQTPDKTTQPKKPAPKGKKAA